MAIAGAIASSAAATDGLGATSANTTAHVPDSAVRAPEPASRSGTARVPRRSRMIQVRSRKRAVTASAMPDSSRAAPPSP